MYVGEKHIIFFFITITNFKNIRILYGELYDAPDKFHQVLSRINLGECMQNINVIMS